MWVGVFQKMLSHIVYPILSAIGVAKADPPLRFLRPYFFLLLCRQATYRDLSTTPSPSA